MTIATFLSKSFRAESIAQRLELRRCVRDSICICVKNLYESKNILSLVVCIMNACVCEQLFARMSVLCVSLSLSLFYCAGFFSCSISFAQISSFLFPPMIRLRSFVSNTLSSSVFLRFTRRSY